MERIMFKSKIHRASITQADLNYEGSLTVDEELMEAANMLTYEKISIVNINNGERIETYLIAGERGSRTICLNGAAARRGAVGDKIIIISYANLSEEEALKHKPTVVLVDDNNNIIDKQFAVEANTIFATE
ncbi:MAG: aspartate 1-decarboxylase [Ignavibacteriae bacterium]|nr:aspartate 1-decarboxylase [Ignavibacteriota bacterium]